MRASPALKRWSLVIIALVFAQACGSIGEPLPPLLNIPERTQDLAVKQIRREILLQWTAPSLTTEGLPVKNLAFSSIHFMELSEPFDLPALAGFERQSKVLKSLEEPDPKQPREGRLTLKVDAANWFGKTLVLGLRSESSRGRSAGFSNLVKIQILPPPPAPPALTLTVEADAIVVSWRAVGSARRYRLFRSDKPSEKPRQIGETEKTEYRDSAFTWDRNYAYRVQSITLTATGEIEGESSEQASVFTTDRFPPAKPRDVRSVATRDSVELSWRPSTAADLAGYQVRRAESAAGPVTAVEISGEKLLTSPRFNDQKAEPGRTYSYTVVAIDQKGNRSEPSDPVSASIP